jgi:hypothetical protein
MMTVAWIRIAERLLGGPRGVGLFAYLAGRDQNKSLLDRENARRESLRDLLDHLPPGAVYAEKTPDGWMEIRKPGAPHASLLMFPIESFQPTEDPCQLAELGHVPKDLENDQVDHRQKGSKSLERNRNPAAS